MPIPIIVVRHGERLDEVDPLSWKKLRTAETSHDPPLTANGWDQARLAGRELRSLLAKMAHPNDGKPSVTIYSSPTSRTLSTAAGLSASLDCNSVTPIYGLNCCAAAKRYGVAKAFPQDVPAAITLASVQLACWPPQGDAAYVDAHHHKGGFKAAVQNLGAAHSEGDVVIVVTHREGIWELQKSIGCRIHSRYCSQHFFNYDQRSGVLSEYELKAPSAPRLSSDKVKQCPKDSAVVASTGAATIAEVLAQGCGTIVIRRSGGAPHLWETPGVRGKWVEGGPVLNGEKVQLLSTPQASENDEGDFVLIRRASGIEGWTKLKNCHLA